MQQESDRTGAVYEPPRLIDLGPMTALTLADGNHFGKVTGGSDAFLLRGQGGLTATSA
jgi:hypothetical protein